MTRSRRTLVIAMTVTVAIVAVIGGLTLWAQPRALIGGSYFVTAQLDVNGTPTEALLLATFTSDGKVMSSDETLFAFDRAAGLACGFVDPAADATDGVARFGPAHGSWRFTSSGALFVTYALGDVKGRRLLRRARGMGNEFFQAHGGPVVIDFFDARDRKLEVPLCAFHGRWEATRIDPIQTDFAQQP